MSHNFIVKQTSQQHSDVSFQNVVHICRVVVRLHLIYICTGTKLSVQKHKKHELWEHIKTDFLNVKPWVLIRSGTQKYARKRIHMATV